METNVNSETSTAKLPRASWNKGKLIGQKAPLKRKEIYAIRTRLQLAKQVRELALFNLAIDSKLRGCDLVKLRVCDIAQGNRVASRAMDCSKRRNARCSLKLPNKRAIPSQPG